MRQELPSANDLKYRITTEAGTRSTAKVATRPVRLKRPREHDSGHVIRGIGHTWLCSCGERGKIERTPREAMQAGRDHAAGHAEHGAAA